MRAFIALPLPGDIQALLGRVRARIESSAGRQLRLVPAHQIHLTVRFLGEMDASQVPGITRELERIAAETPAFEARLSGLGAFPGRGSPRVIWVGIEDAGCSSRVAAAVDAAVVSQGFERESRPFAPHLTLGRRRPGHGGSLDFFDGIQVDPVAFRLDRLVLYESTLKPEGAVHREISVHALGARGGAV